MSDYAIDTLPRPTSDDPWRVSDMLTCMDNDTFHEVTALDGFGAIVALIPEDGHLRGVANLRAKAALSEWIAEAERWRDVAETLALVSDDPLATIADAYKEAGEG